ncbi:autotransporter-associated beta strand repeat-containing protein [Luteolibacter sp. LG18]|uniref:beta strand repeat-containing protein n=1 Tax=Luteolibacter sp. LG18 TaxID=2819286 RepID=UPI002B2F0F9A|nr:hypothetical protein llg_32250 [Luteolibacter sp. LG18]
MKPETIFASLAWILALAGTARATVFTYTSTTNDVWSDSANWNASGVAPTTDSNVARLNFNGSATFAFGTTATYTGTSGGNEGRSIVIGLADTAGLASKLTITSGTIVASGPDPSLIGGGSSNSYAGNAQLILSGGNYTSTSALGVLARGSSAASGTVTINSGSTLKADTVGFGLLAGGAGSAYINVNQGGVLETRAVYEANDVTGTVQLNLDGGTLRATANNASEHWVRNTTTGPTLRILSHGATFESTGTGEKRLSVAMTDGTGNGSDGDIRFTGGGRIVLDANNTNTGDITVDAGTTLVLGNAGAAGSLGSGILVNNGTVVHNRSGNYSQSAVAGLASGLQSNFEQKGSGVFTLDVANSNSGTTAVTGGVLRVTNSGGLGAIGAVSVASGSQIALSGGVTISKNISISGVGVTAAIAGTEIAGGSRGALSSSAGTNTVTGAISVATYGTRIGVQDGAALVLTGPITEVSPSTNVIFRGGVSGTSSITLSNPNNAWTGTTVIYAGNVMLGVDNGIPKNTSLLIGTSGVGTSVLDLNGHNQELAGITSDAVNKGVSQVINNGASDSVLTLNTAVDGSWDGSLKDGTTKISSLVKKGTGTQTLASAQTYTGSTTVQAGTLFVNGALASSQVTVNAGGTFGGTGSIAGPITVAGTLSPGSSATSSATLPTHDLTLTGTYLCHLKASFTDLVDITGNLTITGSALNVSVLQATTLTTYTIARYTGTRTGTFASVTVPSGFMVQYDDANKVIKLVPGTSTPTFNTWAQGYGLDPLTTGAPNADYDKDGIPNALEYVLGTDPKNASASGSTLLVNHDDWTFSFHRAKQSLSSDLTVIVETGDDLTTWPVTFQVGATTAASSTGVTVTSLDANTDQITVTIPKGTSKAFARIKAAVNP